MDHINPVDAVIELVVVHVVMVVVVVLLGWVALGRVDKTRAANDICIYLIHSK